MKRVLIALFAIYLIWGSTYLAVRFALDSFPPFALSGTRFLSAGALLYWISRAHHQRVGISEWASATLVGSLLMAAGNGLVCWGEQTISSGQAALICASTPLWMALWSGYKHGYPGHSTVLGITLSTTGMLVLLGEPAQWSAGSLAVLVASLSWAIGSLASKSLPRPTSTMQFSAMTMLAGGAMMLAVSALSGEQWNVQATPTSLLAWFYLTLIGSLVAMTTYQWLLQHASPTLVATHTYVNPLVAVGLSWLAGENLPQGIPGALLLVSLGIALISLKRISLPNSRVFRPHIPLVGRAF